MCSHISALWVFLHPSTPCDEQLPMPPDMLFSAAALCREYTELVCYSMSARAAANAAPCATTFASCVHAASGDADILQRTLDGHGQFPAQRRVNSAGCSHQHFHCRVVVRMQHAASLTLRSAAEEAAGELRRVNSAGRVPAAQQLLLFS